MENGFDNLFRTHTSSRPEISKSFLAKLTPSIVAKFRSTSESLLCVGNFFSDRNYATIYKDFNYDTFRNDNHRNFVILSC